MTAPHPQGGRPHRAPLPQHRGSRGGRRIVPYQRDPWAPPGWLVAALMAVGLLLVALALTR